MVLIESRLRLQTDIIVSKDKTHGGNAAHLGGDHRGGGTVEEKSHSSALIQFKVRI